MFRTAIGAFLILTLHATSLQLVAQSTCPAKVESFAGEKPILLLPKRYREGIIGAVLPDLNADANGSGYDLEDLRRAKLMRSLQYWPILTNQSHEHLWVVRYTSFQACGPHGNCPSYVISADSNRVHNVLKGRDSSFGTSAGGAQGVAVLPSVDTAHPELLFLSHISAFETAVGCFRWNGSGYRTASCTAECAHFLDSPRPH